VDPAAGRVALQDLTGTAATLGNNIQNLVGFADATFNTADAQFAAIIAVEDYGCRVAQR